MSGQEIPEVVRRGWVSFLPHSDGVEMVWHFFGGGRGVTFHVRTGWLPPGVQRVPSAGEPIALAYHSPYRISANNTEDNGCYMTAPAQCFHGGTWDAAEPWLLLLTEGDDAVWRFLNAYYETVFAEPQLDGEAVGCD